MANTRELEVSINDWEARYVLESLFREMNRLKLINATSEDEDEDEAADAGNDCIEISGFYERLSEKAVSVFGEQILNFCRDPI
ncbi:hypothetical protein [Aliikangiella maris]|uniref:Uncharacterized protein n=2 Tax=Aliikangiella maris TaxID=3162458 RepID=A0ABV3MSW2_9GAMM